MTFSTANTNRKSEVTLLVLFASILFLTIPDVNLNAQGVRLTNPVLNGNRTSNHSFQNLRGMDKNEANDRMLNSDLGSPLNNHTLQPANVQQQGPPGIQPFGQKPNSINSPTFNNPNIPRNGVAIPGRNLLRQFPDPRFEAQQNTPANAPVVQPNTKIPRFSIPNPRIPGALPESHGSQSSQKSSPNIGTPTGNGREVIKERYNNGVVRIERQVIQDQDKNYINHGFWKFYLPNGRVAAQAYFDRGKKSGAWSRWLTAKETPLFKTAPLNQFRAPFLTTFHYVDDALQGKWKLADAANRTVFEINLKDGKRDSLCVWYLPNGQKHQEIQYKNGLLHGTFMKWNLQGKLIEKRQFENGHEIGHITEFHRPGVKKLEYGVLAGQVEPLTKDSPWNLEFATEKKIGPDIKHGPVSAWYPNGQVRFSGHFNKDVQEGDFVWYYETGQKQAEGKFSNDERVDLWVWWHENGMRASVGKYAEGTPTGNWQWWMENGQLARSQEFESESTRLGDAELNSADTMKNASFRNGDK